MANLVDLTGSFDIDDVLGEIDVKTVIDSYGAGVLLNLIGEEEAMAHFGLVEPEQEKASEV